MNTNTLKYYNRPVLFYFLSTATTYAALYMAQYVDTPVGTNPTGSGIFVLMGLFFPTVIAFAMMYFNKHLRNDLFERIFNISQIKPLYLALACCLMPASILLAQAVSLLFGYSASQFALAQQSSFTFSLFPAWVMLFLAPLVEELAWHSYGTDCLRNRFSLFTTSMLFAFFWVIWHLPLSFIHDYYHSNLVEIGVAHSLNFVISLFPFVLLMNWIYYKGNRNILLAVIFHITAGLFNELFATHPDTKIIQTALLTILSIALVIQNKTFFFCRSYTE